MRFAPWSILCALTIAGGCATTTRLSRPFYPAPGPPLSRCTPRLLGSFAVDESRPDTLSPRQEVALRRAAVQAADSVVRVTVFHGEPDNAQVDSRVARATSRRTGGSGVVIASNGLILTSEHVVRRAEKVTVTAADGVKYAARAVAIDPLLDLAVLRINRSGLKPLPASTRDPRPQEPVVAVARSIHHDSNQVPVVRVRLGIITDATCSLQRELDPTRGRNYARLLETTAWLEPGFSGGPLLDSAGRLVGIGVAATDPNMDDGPARGYAIPFDEPTRRAVRRLMREVEGARPFTVSKALRPSAPR